MSMADQTEIRALRAEVDALAISVKRIADSPLVTMPIRTIASGVIIGGFLLALFGFGLPLFLGQ
jgi:hypothetical protein